ncbi:hypothetical protein BGP_6166 [Beggiatoa sp. PS]|nr:hypothetical protein BGP_6166 [Beggiatoa sp. PS]
MVDIKKGPPVVMIGGPFFFGWVPFQIRCTLVVIFILITYHTFSLSNTFKPIKEK